MTVTTTNITAGPYAGNGTSNTFSYGWRVTTKNELQVYETDDAGVQTLLTVDTHYTVNGIGGDAGGTLTRLAGNLPMNYSWYVRANYAETQQTVFRSQGGFLPDVHEAQMDHITFLIQQLRDSSDRSFRLADSVPNDSSFTINENATERAGSSLLFDNSGDLIYGSPQVARGFLGSAKQSGAATIITGSTITSINFDTIIDDPVGVFPVAGTQFIIPANVKAIQFGVKIFANNTDPDFLNRYLHIRNMTLNKTESSIDIPNYPSTNYYYDDGISLISPIIYNPNGVIQYFEIQLKTVQNIDTTAKINELSYEVLEFY